MANRPRSMLMRQTSAVSEMSPLRRKRQENNDTAEWVTSAEYKFTPFKGDASQTTGQWSHEDHGGGGGTRKSEVQSNHKTFDCADGGRNTPNSLAAAWRNSYTLRKSTGDLSTAVGVAAPMPTPRSRSNSQCSRQSAGGRRLPLSLPHVQPNYAPYMMYDTPVVPVRPWSTCGYAQPWLMNSIPVTTDVQPCNGKAEMHGEKSNDAEFKKDGQANDLSEVSKSWSSWRSMQMLAILQLVLSVAVITAGLIRSVLGVYMAIGTEVCIGIFTASMQVVTIVGLQKKSSRFLFAGFVGSIVECSLLAFPIVACIQSLQNEHMIYQHVVSIFVVALCIAQLGVVAIALGYVCHAAPKILQLLRSVGDPLPEADSCSTKQNMDKKCQSISNA